MADTQGRAHKILEAIIRTYAEIGSPVGSEFLLQRHDFGVSSATIRNIMAELEAQGLITHPHTSAGRIPTDHGYRYYVDLLMERGRLYPEEEEQIEWISTTAEDDPIALLEEASRVLSGLAREAGVALVPQLVHGSFRRMELIAVGPKEVVGVLISNEGLVKHGRLELEAARTPEEVKRLERFLNEELSGMSLRQAAAYLGGAGQSSGDPRGAGGSGSGDLGRLAGLFQEEPSVILEGASWVLEAPEFQDIRRTRQLIRGLENEEGLASILQRDLGAQELKVHIGSENRGTSLDDCSIVAAPYRLAGGVMGTIGVLGPTRMDYPRITGLVQRVAECVSRVMRKRWPS